MILIYRGNLTINPNKSYRFKDLQCVALYILVNLTVSGKSLAAFLVSAH